MDVDEVVDCLGRVNLLHPPADSDVEANQDFVW